MVRLKLQDGKRIVGTLIPSSAMTSLLTALMEGSEGSEAIETIHWCMRTDFSISRKIFVMILAIIFVSITLTISWIWLYFASKAISWYNRDIQNVNLWTYDVHSVILPKFASINDVMLALFLKRKKTSKRYQSFI